MATLSMPAFSLELQLKDFLAEFKKLKPAEAGVGAIGPGAAYALVWEWGNARQTQLGPRTTRGINPDGKEVWLSLQAPRGYIRINTPLYWAALERELARMKFGGTSTGAIQGELDGAATRVANRIRDIIKEYVPVDSGQLHGNIQTVEAGDDLLDEEDSNPLLIERQ